jgi:flagellar basal-body rod modification protein FlgD
MIPLSNILNAASPQSTAVTTPPAPTATGSAAASATASNLLGPNSFITLLTAQLQAQDPLNPMDPNQMVDELTNMNTLQQTIQMRQDLDALLASSTGKAPVTTATSGATANGAASAGASASKTLNTISPNLSALSGSASAVSAAKQYAKAQVQSQF